MIHPLFFSLDLIRISVIFNFCFVFKYCFYKFFVEFKKAFCKIVFAYFIYLLCLMQVTS